MGSALRLVDQEAGQVGLTIGMRMSVVLFFPARTVLLRSSYLMVLEFYMSPVFAAWLCSSRADLGRSLLVS